MNTLKIKTAIAALFLLIVSSASFASTTTNSSKSPVEKANVIEYAGQFENGRVFNLKYQNTDAKKVRLVLKNQDGDVLFQDTFTEKEINKKIVLGNDSNASSLSFIVKTSKGEYVQRFSIQDNAVSW